jgi:hypothetical protein
MTIKFGFFMIPPFVMLQKNRSPSASYGSSRHHESNAGIPLPILPALLPFDVIWHRYKKEGLFRALCEFDPDNLNKLLDYAVAKKAFSSASHHFEK